MKESQKIWILIIAISLVCQASLFSQIDLEDGSVIKNYSAVNYFVEEEPFVKYNIISTNFLSYLAGDFHFTYEFQLLPLLSTVVGVGIVSNRNALGSLNELVNGIPKHNKPVSKIGFSLGLKYYLDEFPKGLYVNTNFRTRRYYGGDVYDLYLGTGYQKQYKNNIIIGVGIGYGYRLIDYDIIGSNLESELVRFNPIDFYLGYTF